MTPQQRDEVGLLSALLADLSDPLARAAYCDWLEENGMIESREPMARKWPPGTPAPFGWGCGPPGGAPTLWEHKFILPFALFALLKGSKEVGVGVLYYETREAALEAMWRAVEELRPPV